MKAIPISLFREVRKHKGIATRALLTGWGLWILGLLWFFPFVSPYFFGNELSVAFSPSDPIASVWSLMIMPVGAQFSIAAAGFLKISNLVFGIVLPFIVAATCGWLIARFHRSWQKEGVLLFAGSILLTDLLLFGAFVLRVGSGVAYGIIGPLSVYAAASVLGILLGGGLLRNTSDSRRERPGVV